MPASVTDGPCPPDALEVTKSGDTLDFNAYLVKNFSLTDSSCIKQADSLPWASDLSLEISEPVSPLTKTYDNVSVLDLIQNASLESTEIEEAFNFYEDLAKKALSTPDPAAFRAALKADTDPGKLYERDEISRNESRDLVAELSTSSYQSFRAGLNGENMSKASIADTSRGHSKIHDSLNSSKRDWILDHQTFTPKVSSEIRKGQLRSIMRERTVRTKRTLARNLSSKSIPNFMILEFMTPSPERKPRISSTDVYEMKRRRTRSVKAVGYPVTRCRLFRLSEKESSRRSERVSDSCYASYLDYVDISKAVTLSPTNDCPFESPKYLRKCRNVEKQKLESVYELSLEGCFGIRCSGLSPSVMVDTREAKLGPVVPFRQGTPNKPLTDTYVSVDIKELVLSTGFLGLVADVQLVPRPMSLKTKLPVPVKKENSILQIASVVGFKALENVILPVKVQAILREELEKVMGNGGSRSLATHKFIPGVGKRENFNYTIQRRRYGPREVHKNIWRLERKPVGGKPATDTETETRSTPPQVPKRSTYRKNRKYCKERQIVATEKDVDGKVSCGSPNGDSLPSRSDVLPPDGDSLRSDPEKKCGSVAEIRGRCPSCTSSQLKLSKAYAQKGAVAVTLEKTQRDLTNSQTRIKELEKELEEYRKNAEELSVNVKELETEMCHLQKEKALLQQELNVTRKQLTRLLEQSDSSDSSHVSSVFVSGSQTLDDGLVEDVIPDEEYDEGNGDSFRKLAEVQEQLEAANVEIARLKEIQLEKEKMEVSIRRYEERIIELEEQLRVSTPRLDATKETSTQTLVRDGTFTKQSDRTKIPKRMLGHHSSLPVITDSNNVGRSRTPTGGSLTRMETLQKSLRIKEKEITTLKREMSGLNKELEKHKEREITLQNSRASELRVENDRLQDELKLIRQNYQRETVMRKKYFNLAEDLKGKIRVFCRIKPTDEIQKMTAPVLEIPDEYTVLLRTHRAQYEFTFDKVLDVDCSQDDIFADVENLVQSALDGYNVCIFAYGQTGSGKTFTLLGSELHPGIGPRAFQKMFDLARENQSELDFRIFVSVYELYNDHLIDLLNDVSEDRLKIRRDHYGLVYVHGSETREVRNESELLDIFEEACRNRHVGATRMNTQSSRSHLIISIRIESTNKITGTVSRGKFSIVDLAGSERVGKTAAVADQLREANSINKSLSALGDVIAALSSDQSYVPYRNNKLTLLMQDSLGSNAKTLMFVTISSSEQNVEESLNSLTYASRVKQITNSASRMAESKEVARLRSIILKLTKENKNNVKN